MKEKNILRFAILFHWTLFWGLSVLDKIIPAVQMNWVGKDFFTLFVKLFESLGIKDPVFATIALISISTFEAIIFSFYLFSTIQFFKGDESLTQKWFSRAVLSSVVLFTLFSIGDNVFGDRFQLLEHGLFWMILLASWAVFKFIAPAEDATVALKANKGSKTLLALGALLVIITSFSIVQFSHKTFGNSINPVEGKEVVDGIYKFDMPFLADRDAMQKTVTTFKEEHPNLEVTYIYTGPSELNSKKKTHVLLYLFTEVK